MKFGRLLLLIILSVVATDVAAQFSISRVKPSTLETKDFADSIKGATYSNEFFNLAKWEAERRRIRKERNTVELNASLQASQTQFENWAAGGDNTFSGRSTIFFRHEYKRDRLKVEYRLEARYGINVIGDKPFKNEDEFKINFMTSWQIRHNWSYAGSVNLRSQFTKGYKSRDDKTMKSTFMSPGFLDITLGFNYKKPDSPFSITISPLTGSITTMINDQLSAQGLNGVEKGRSSKGQMGPSIRVDFDKQFFKDVFRFRSYLHSFTNIKTSPTVRWENTFEVRATKFLTMTVYALCYYDKLANTPKPQSVQYNYSFSIGLGYKFKNK